LRPTGTYAYELDVDTWYNWTTPPFTYNYTMVLNLTRRSNMIIGVKAASDAHIALDAGDDDVCAARGDWRL
jgi:hypothetical protein